jgi:hypothetical protein
MKGDTKIFAIASIKDRLLEFFLAAQTAEHEPNCFAAPADAPSTTFLGAR